MSHPKCQAPVRARDQHKVESHITIVSLDTKTSIHTNLRNPIIQPQVKPNNYEATLDSFFHQNSYFCNITMIHNFPLSDTLTRDLMLCHHNKLISRPNGLSSRDLVLFHHNNLYHASMGFPNDAPLMHPLVTQTIFHHKHNHMFHITHPSKNDQKSTI